MRILTLLLFAVVLVPCAGFGQFAETKVPVPESGLIYSAAISGDYAAVGTETNFFIFRRSNGMWEQAAEFRPPGARAEEVAMTDSCIFVVGLQDALVLALTDTGWAESAELTPATIGQLTNRFESVAVRGNSAILGASNSDVGSVQFFRRSGDVWVEEDTLTDDQAPSFGVSVAISGDRAFVGRSGSVGGTATAGAVHIFKRNQSGWSEETKLMASNGFANDGFGRVLAVADSGVVVFSGGLREAYAFAPSGDTWRETRLGRFTRSNTPSGYRNVGGAGNRVAVGSYAESNFRGAAYLFTRSGSGWTTPIKVTASDGVGGTFPDGDRFGESVALSKTDLIVTAHGADAVYIYDLDMPVSVERPEPAVPASFILKQNYPNPFNPGTTIPFRLARRAKVTLEVYNLRGEKVSTLVNGTRPAGEHRVRLDGSRLASGIYFYRLTAGEVVLARKMILHK